MLKNKNIFKSASKLLLVLLVMTVVSCDSKVVYETHIDISGEEWDKDSVYEFSYQADTILSQAVKFYFNIRNTSAYKYQNLWLFSEVEVPNNASRLDTINLEFMDDLGNWKDGVSGGRIKESRHFVYGIRNAPKGEYKIRVRHGMRDSSLKNMVSIGFRIEKI